MQLQPNVMRSNTAVIVFIAMLCMDVCFFFKIAYFLNRKAFVLVTQLYYAMDLLGYDRDYVWHLYE